MYRRCAVRPQAGFAARSLSGFAPTGSSLRASAKFSNYRTLQVHLPEFGLQRPRLVQMVAPPQSALVAAMHWPLASVQRPSVRHWLLAWQSPTPVGEQALVVVSR